MTRAPAVFVHAFVAGALLSAVGCGSTKKAAPAHVEATPEFARVPRVPITPTTQARNIVGAPDRSDEDRALDAGRGSAELLTFLDLQPGMRVAELMAGGGYTVELLARAVGPTGAVFGVNPPLVLEKFAQKPWSERLAQPANMNVVRLDRELDDPFDAGTKNLDVVVMSLVYHDTGWLKTDRTKMNAAIFAALRPGGSFVVIDHSARPGRGLEDGATLHRIEDSVVLAEVTAAGFALDTAADFLRNPEDDRDWSAAPGAAKERRGTSDRFVLRFKKPLTPPIAKKVPQSRALHGDTFVDDYFWLRNKGTPEVEGYLHAEDDYADAMLAPLAPLRETLFAEIVSHIAEDDESAPVKDGAWVTWRRFKKGQSYPVYLRKKTVAGSAEEVVLDVNVLAQGKDFLGIGALDINDQGTWLLYSTDDTGFRQYDLQFKELTTGKLSPEKVAKVVAAEWAADGKTVFYVVEDEAKRPYRVYRHTVGTDPKSDALVYEEKDGRFELWIYRTTSRSYVALHSESKLGTEVRLVDAKKPTSAPFVVEPRADNVKYFVDHRGTDLWLRTNDTGRNFRIVKAPVNSTGKPAGRKAWKEVRKHDDKVMLENFVVFAGFSALETREGGLPHLVVTDFASGKTERIAMPEPDYTAWVDQNPEPNPAGLRYGYTSLSTPRSVYNYDVKKKTSTLIKEDPVPGGFDRKRYVTEYVHATAKDGTKIPISLVYDKTVVKDGNAPMHLNAYGSYGYSYDVSFRPERLPLLDRGVIYAIAHIRGGGELGKTWHEQGRMAHKMNTFTDFIACTEHLIAQKYTSAQRLTIEGGSAGGLLMGAVTNLRPELFKAVINDVGFVDVINTMNDPTLPLTITEYEEWGNPGVAAQYGWMRPYSPYDNLAKKDYPTLLVRSSYNDSQVMYWEPAKYVARLRALKTDANPLFFKVKMEAAGHGGKSGRYDRYRDDAFDQAFLLWQQGVVAMPAR